jgi:hypothetical protein
MCRDCENVHAVGSAHVKSFIRSYIQTATPLHAGIFNQMLKVREVEFNTQHVLTMEELDPSPCVILRITRERIFEYTDSLLSDPVQCTASDAV